MTPFKLLGCLLLALQVTAYRVDKSIPRPLLQKRVFGTPTYPPEVLTEIAEEYRDTAGRAWAYLKNKLRQGGNDKPCADIANLELYWTFDEDVAPASPEKELEDILYTLHIPTDKTYIRIDSETPVPDAPLQGKYAKAYKQLFKPIAGIIIVEYLETQEEYLDGHGVGQEHWSDITARTWQQAPESLINAYGIPSGPGPFPLNYVVHWHVRNTETEAVINDIIMKDHQQPTGAKQTFYPHKSDQAKSPDPNSQLLLGSPNGRGLSYMLGDFQRTFQRKTIKSATLESKTPPNQNHIWWHLTWELEPYTVPEQF